MIKLYTTYIEEMEKIAAKKEKAKTVARKGAGAALTAGGAVAAGGAGISAHAKQTAGRAHGHVLRDKLRRLRERQYDVQERKNAFDPHTHKQTFRAQEAAGDHWLNEEQIDNYLPHMGVAGAGIGAILAGRRLLKDRKQSKKK